MRGGTSTLERGDTLAHPRVDDGGTDLDDWFCIEIRPWRCQGCAREIKHISFSDEKVQHGIIVWPSQDDPHLRKSFQKHELNGTAVAIVPYERALGPAVSFYEWQRLNDEGRAESE